MKTLRIFPLVTLFISIASFSFAQKSKTETFKVAGECGMCKKKIEKAAKEAGATEAVWNQESKMLKVTYASATTNTAAIQQKIAGVGYDTPQYKSTDEAYNKLDACCQYERESAKAKMACCSETCDMKDGKCADKAVCAQKGCCKDAKACEEKGCCKEKTSSTH